MKTLAVVCITYNHEKYIGKTIEGIINQNTSFDFELIISDDCSTDGTVKIIKDYQKKYPNIIKPIFRKKNLGSINNYIETLSYLDYKYVAICDGDDLWIDNNKLQSQYDYLEQHKEFTICFHSVKEMFENSDKFNILPNYVINDITTFDDLKKDNFIPNCSVMYRFQYCNKNMKEIIPNNIANGDYYLHLLHAKLGKIKMLGEPMAIYYRHENGIWWESHNNYDLFYIKHGIEILNFYKNISELYNLEDYYCNKLDHLMSECIRIFLRHDDFEQLIRLKNIDLERFNKYLKKNRGMLLYPHLSKIKKILFRLLFGINK